MVVLDYRDLVLDYRDGVGQQWWCLTVMVVQDCIGGVGL